MSVVEYSNKETDLQLLNYSQCLKFIQEHVVPDMLAGSNINGNEITYRKITKNDNIRETVDKLQSDPLPVTCIFTYGPHIQKMLSILEIYKKVIYENSDDSRSNIKIHQWNKLSWFTNKVDSKNELIQTCKRIPIMLTVVIKDEGDQFSSKIQLESRGFSRQS